MKEIQIQILGIHCGGCISQIEERLIHRGVLRFDLDYKTWIADIEYDEEMITKETIIQSITSLGFKVAIIPSDF